LRIIENSKEDFQIK